MAAVKAPLKTEDHETTRHSAWFALASMPESRAVTP